MRMRQVLLLLSLLVVGLNLNSGRAQVAPGNDAAARCLALRNADFSREPDAPTQIIEAKLVSGDTLSYCQVSGYVTPNVGFLLRLPSTTWNGKFLELGCGGFCGSTDHIVECEGPLRRGYACIVSDNGHQSTILDAKWAYNNLQAEIDHAYRGAHVTALAGKAIVEHYYGQAPQQSYFSGCSTGGRQALMEAQRFPWDFDGILAGNPSLSVPGIYMHLLWANRAITDRAGEPLLGQADLETLHRAVVAKCDLNDGVKDGLIGDPRACAFDPTALRCTPRDQTGCLTPKQLDAVKKLYGGPMTSKGEHIYMPGPLPGSERTWLDSFRGPASNPRSQYNFAADAFRYSAFQPSPGPSWMPEAFDFDRDYQRLGMAEGLYAADNPDLRRFKAAGGKLLAFTGWNDAIGMPLPTVDYYETVEKTMGGRAATQEFFRLFVIPGMNHCTLGDGAFAVDWLSYLEAWVERGQAPQHVIGFHVKVDDLQLDHPNYLRQLLRRLEFPPDPTTVEFSRPAYPYPTVTNYLGRDNPKDAANFGPVAPRRRPHAVAH